MGRTVTLIDDINRDYGPTRYEVGDKVPDDVLNSGVSHRFIPIENIEIRRQSRGYWIVLRGESCSWGLACQSNFNIVDDETNVLIFTSRDYCESLVRAHGDVRFMDALEHFIADGFPMSEKDLCIEDDEWVEI